MISIKCRDSLSDQFWVKLTCCHFMRDFFFSFLSAAVVCSSAGVATGVLVNQLQPVP